VLLKSHIRFLEEYERICKEYGLMINYDEDEGKFILSDRYDDAFEEQIKQIKEDLIRKELDDLTSDLLTAFKRGELSLEDFLSGCDLCKKLLSLWDCHPEEEGDEDV